MLRERRLKICIQMPVCIKDMPGRRRSLFTHGQQPHLSRGLCFLLYGAAHAKRLDEVLEDPMTVNTLM